MNYNVTLYSRKFFFVFFCVVRIKLKKKPENQLLSFRIWELGAQCDADFNKFIALSIELDLQKSPYVC